jgi:hypothetical protein
MPLNRRRFLLLSIAAGLVGQSKCLLAAVVSTTFPNSQSLDAEQSRCLQAWTDTLLPADEVSPAASKLGVPSRLADKALGNPDYLKLIRAGCRWLNRQARKVGTQAFVGLDVSEREGIVRLAEQSAAKSLPLAFFEHTRDDIFHFYYAQPETWVMLDYQGPPQPLGFMDRTRPPAG